jgi:hypothetical protein
MQGGCKGTTRAGEPCNATPRPGRPWCAWHDPDLADKQAAWRAKGGERHSNASRASAALPKDLADVRDALLRTLSGLEGGEVRPQTATAMAAVARALVAVQEAGALERATAALETSQEWHALRGEILAALAPYPAAKVALAEVLSAGGA